MLTQTITCAPCHALQVVDMGEAGPIRCNRCRAYLNPYMRWTEGGRTFTCNFCNHSNPSPDAYFCHLSPDGLRRDAYERPELCKGSVEYVATKDYMVRQPMAPAHFFVVDVSAGAQASGATATACACIEGVLDSLQGAAPCLYGDEGCKCVRVLVAVRRFLRHNACCLYRLLALLTGFVRSFQSLLLSVDR